MLKNFKLEVKTFFIVALVATALTIGGILLLKTTGLEPAEQPESSPIPTVQKSISLTSPQGTEQWEVGSTQTITWTSTGIEKVRISPAVGGKGLATTQEIDASLGMLEDFVVPDMSGFGTAPPYEITILIFDAQDANVSDKVTFTAIEPFSASGKISQDKESCETQGGAWSREGLAQEFMCVFAYSDGGKFCVSSDECEGSCLVTDYNQTTGVCDSDSSPFGCYAVIENLREGTGILCVD